MPPHLKSFDDLDVMLEQNVVLCQNFLALLLCELFRHSIHSCVEALPQLCQVSLQWDTELGDPQFQRQKPPEPGAPASKALNLGATLLQIAGQLPCSRASG